MREMSAEAREDNRIFVGGLASDVTERQLEHAFNRFGKIIDSQIMLERDSGRHRGFGFLTFADCRGMEDAIREMHGREFGDRLITVNRAEPKNVSDSLDHGNRGGYSSGGRERSYGKGDRSSGKEGCFNCGRPGHWARECQSAGSRGGYGGPRSRYGEADGRGSRFGGDRGERDRDIAERFGVGRYGDKDRYLDDRYGGRGTQDRYVEDRYPPGRDRYASDRYGGSDRYPENGFVRDKVYDRDIDNRGSSRYGNGGPAREGRSYRGRLAPYDRPSRGGRPSSFDRF